MSTQVIVITFEFKIKYDKQKFKTKKKQAAVIIATVIFTVTDVTADLSEISEQSTVLNSWHHASELLEHTNIHLENLERADDHQQTIMQHWKYHNDQCCNQNNICYVDSWDDKHYSVDRVQHEIWVNAVAADNAVTD